MQETHEWADGSYSHCWSGDHQRNVASTSVWDNGLRSALCDSAHCGVVTYQQNKYTARKLLCSDDLVICVENHDGLQKAIDEVRRYSSNTEKTRVLWIMAHD